MSDSKVTEAQVLGALSKVIDPDLHKDIVTLGFIEDLKITGDGDVSFRVVLTTPACPMKEKMRGEAHEYVSAIPGVRNLDITMDAKVAKFSTVVPQNMLPNVGNILAIASGKGGVGKSTVATNIAVALAHDGCRVGLLDADIYGPSIPMMMGVDGVHPAITPEKKIVPIDAFGVKVMSIGFLIPQDQAVIWRGPMVGAAIKQFLGDVDWGELDYLVIDLPPGTGNESVTTMDLIGDVTGSSAFAIKTGLGVVSFGDLLTTIASAAGHAGFRLPHGAAPSSPGDGDVWTTTSGLFVRINGVTKTVTLT